MAGDFVLMLRFMNPRDWLAIFAYLLDVVIKRKIVTDFHAQVLGASNRFKDMPMQQVFIVDWGSSSCNVYDNTLGGVESHVPLKFPLMEMVKILL